MAKQRIVDTRFWVDDYTANLDPIEKLLFLYFLTNPATDISGVYEIPIKNIALDTGIDKEMVNKILERFSRDGKIFYESGWVGIRNFIKYQTLNPKVISGIKIGLNKGPKSLIDSLCIDYDRLSHLNSNSNPNSNPNSNLNPNDCLFEARGRKEGDKKGIVISPLVDKLSGKMSIKKQF